MGILRRWLVSGSEVGEGCLTVAGDAFHPMTANVGQGGCIALEVMPRFCPSSAYHLGLFHLDLKATFMQVHLRSNGFFLICLICL